MTDGGGPVEADGSYFSVADFGSIELALEAAARWRDAQHKGPE